MEHVNTGETIKFQTLDGTTPERSELVMIMHTPTRFTAAPEAPRSGPGDLPHTNIRNIMYASDLVEAVAFTLAIVYGLWYIAPWDLFSGAIAYQRMAEFATENQWGSLFVGLGGIQAYGWMRSWRSFRRTTALIAIVVWASVWAATIAGNPRSAGTIIFPFSFIFYNFVAYLRLGNKRIGKYVNQ